MAMSPGYFEHMRELTQNTETPGDVLIAVGLAMVADSIATSAERLGNGDAATPMGAIEGLSKSISEGFAALSDSIDDTANREQTG